MPSLQHTTRTIALVGASNKPERASYGVMAFLLSKGYVVYPVNPVLAGQEIQGQKVYASLEDCPAPIDMVDIFRNNEDAAKLIDEAIALKEKLQLKTIWCQLGVTPVDAAKRAQEAGLAVVMDRCLAIEWR
ncbi:MAG: CoA-binding protein [Rickettsiales bacterium]